MQPIPIAPGDKFSRLTVIRSYASHPKSGRRWVCQCTCGREKIATSSRLASGGVQSCGCLKDEGRPVVHGHARSGREHPLYNIWKGMVARCTIPSATSYPLYGALGIKVCDRWLGSSGFTRFLEDMGERPESPAGWSSTRPYWSLDRINPLGDYEPANCRWADPSTQTKNQRRYS